MTALASEAPNFVLPALRCAWMASSRSVARLPHAPQRRCPELVTPGTARQDVIGQAWPHLVQGEVGVEVRLLVAKRCHRAVTRHEGGRVAERAADRDESLAASIDRR